MSNPNLPISGKYNTYIGARYVPLMGGEWNQDKAYEPLVIVTYQGNSYTSNTFVPAGTDINDKTYWTLTGNYNGQVEQYRSEVEGIKGEVQDVNQNVNQLNESLGETNNNLVELQNTVNSNMTNISELTDQLNSINNSLSDTRNKVVGTPTFGSFDILLCTNGLINLTNFNQYHETLTLDTILPNHLTYIIVTNNDIMTIAQLAEFVEKNRVQNRMSKFYAFVYADESKPELIVNSHITFLYSNIDNVTYWANIFPQVIGLKLINENSAKTSLTQMIFKNVRNDIVTSLASYTQSYILNGIDNFKYTSQWHVTPDSVLCYGWFTSNAIPGNYTPVNGEVIIKGTPVNHYVIASHRQECYVMVKYVQNSQMYYTIATIYPLQELKFVLYPNSSSLDVSNISIIKTLDTTNIIERFPSNKESIEPKDFQILMY